MIVGCVDITWYDAEVEQEAGQLFFVVAIFWFSCAFQRTYVLSM